MSKKITFSLLLSVTLLLSVCTDNTMWFKRLPKPKLAALSLLFKRLPKTKLTLGLGALYNLTTEAKAEEVRTPEYSLGDRPLEVQRSVDEAFEGNRDASTDDWLYNGATSYYYLLNIDEDKVLKDLVLKDKSDIYLVDIGCARGGWGEYVWEILQNKEYKESGKKFHIISITGGQECGEMVRQNDHVTLHQINQFKIENIAQELKQRGFDLEDKVDFMVSRWTLRHLVDPFGTMKQLYTLLSPEKGMLSSNGFLFKSSDEPSVVQTFPLRNAAILAHATPAVLFRQYNEGRDAHQFLLMKEDKKQLELPLEYTGSVHNIPYGYQNESKTVTVFNKEHKEYKESCGIEYVDESRYLYCNKSDERCKKLYHYLKNRNLFCGPD